MIERIKNQESRLCQCFGGHARIKNACIIVFFVLFLMVYQKTLAQTTSLPQFMVTWQAENYAPADFLGKLLPTNNTPIEVVFNLLQDGKILDLSKTGIRWYVNDKLPEEGAGKQTLRFVASDLFVENQTIRINIPNYKGQELTHTLVIPIVVPQVVIQAPYLSGALPYGEARFKALPYFFNITNLLGVTLNWFVNGVQPKSEGIVTNPDELVLSTPKEIPVGTETEVRVSLQNRKNETEFASQSLLLRVIE